MDDTTILGGALNQLGQTAKKAGQQIVKIPKEISEDLGEQIGMTKSDEQQQMQKSGWKSDEERIKFLKDLYGVDSKTAQEPAKQASSAKQNSQDMTKGNAQAVQDKKPSEFQEQIKDKTPEEQKKLIELRNQLHRDFYYDPTFNPVKKQEERPAEKVENEKKKETMDLQEKDAKKPPPLAVVREQNKAEMFRGAAG
jgi:hypothetical protein